MKEMGCSVCGYITRVDEKATKVTCAECYIAKERPTRMTEYERYWRPETFDRIFDLDGWEKQQIKKGWETAQEMRYNGWTIRKIARKLGSTRTSVLRHTVGKKVIDDLPYAGGKNGTTDPHGL